MKDFWKDYEKIIMIWDQSDTATTKLSIFLLYLIAIHRVNFDENEKNIHSEKSLKSRNKNFILI